MKKNENDKNDVEETNWHEKYLKMEEAYHSSEKILQQLLENQEKQKREASWVLYQGIAQTLYSIIIGIKMAINSNLEEKLKDYFRVLEQSTQEVLEKAKKLSFDLYPQVIEDIGFITALTTYTKLLKNEGYYIDLQLEGEPNRYNVEEESMFFRIIHEIIRFLIELKVISMKITLSIHDKAEKKFLFTCHEGEQKLNAKILTEGLMITRKRVLYQMGSILIAPCTQIEKQWSIEVVIP